MTLLSNAALRPEEQYSAPPPRESLPALKRLGDQPLRPHTAARPPPAATGGYHTRGGHASSAPQAGSYARCPEGGRHRVRDGDAYQRHRLASGRLEENHGPGPAGSSSRPRIHCTVCGCPGHVEAVCRYRGKGVECYHCKRFGHKRLYCPALFSGSALNVHAQGFL